MRKVSLCYAVYQNAGSLEELYLRSRKAMEENFPDLEVEFIFVDDGSTDGSLQELQVIKSKNADERIKIITLTRNFGQMAAIVAGWQHATGDAAINLAADLQDPPEQCVPMIKEWLAGKDVVISYRKKHGTSWFRLLTSKIAYRTLLPDIPDGGFDFTLLSRRALNAMLKLTERNRFYQYDVLWIGFDPAFLPYEKGQRKVGKSQYSFWKRLAFFTMAYVNSSYSPLRLMASFGLFFAVAGFVYAAAIVYAWLMHRTPFEGWAPIMVLMLVMGGSIMIMLGILGEYLWRVLDESKRRPLAFRQHFEARYWNFLFPFCVLVAIPYLQKLPKTVYFAMIAIALASGFMWSKKFKVPQLPPEYQTAKSLIPDGAVVLTANPWQFAFHTRIPSVATPYSPDPLTIKSMAGRYGADYLVFFGDGRHEMHKKIDSGELQLEFLEPVHRENRLTIFRIKRGESSHPPASG